MGLNEPSEHCFEGTDTGELGKSAGRFTRSIGGGSNFLPTNLDLMNTTMKSLVDPDNCAVNC
jgi:hypothetical protein